VIDDTNVYFVDTDSGELSFVAKSGGGAGSLARIEGLVAGVAVHRDAVYWSDEAGLWRVARSGSKPEQLDTVAGKFLFDGETLYYERAHEIVARDLTGADEPRSIAWIQGSVGGIALAGDDLYWGDFNANTVSRIHVTRAR
jgi:hypothetical protein